MEMILGIVLIILGLTIIGIISFVLMKKIKNLKISWGDIDEMS